jgi:hypothetical protein
MSRKGESVVGAKKIKTPLLDILGIDHPIIQAGMGGKVTYQASVRVRIVFGSTGTKSPWSVLNAFAPRVFQ